MTLGERGMALRERLREAGFDLRQPDPLLSWRVFKEFTAADGTGEGLGVEVGDYSLDFVWFVRSYRKAGETYCETITITHYSYHTPPGRRTGIARAALYSNDFADRESFFEAVEAMPGFRAGVAFDGWWGVVKWEVL